MVNLGNLRNELNDMKSKIWISIAAIVFGLDQLTKYLASTYIGMDQIKEVMPYFNLVLMHNKGAAFSFLINAGGWQRWLFTAIAIIVSIFIISMLRKLSTSERISVIGLACILGGALGNLFDRLLYGHVIDFIQWYYKGEYCLIGFSKIGNLCIWPSFNIADSAIFIGAVLYVLDNLFIQPRLNAGSSKSSAAP